MGFWAEGLGTGIRDKLASSRGPSDPSQRNDIATLIRFSCMVLRHAAKTDLFRVQGLGFRRITAEPARLIEQLMIPGI